MIITNIECPNCKKNAIDVNDWFWKYSKSSGIYYFKCKECKSLLGSTLSYKGDLCIWRKSDE